MKSYKRGYEVTPLSYNTPPITIFEFIELNIIQIRKQYNYSIYYNIIEYN